WELLPLPRIFARLELRQVFRLGEVSATWKRASFGLEAWSQLHLCAERRHQTAIRHPEAECNIHLLSDEGLFRVAERLRCVAASGGEDLDVLPQHAPLTKLGDKANPASKKLSAWRPSQVEVFKYCFANEDRWVLQYNTESFGWFDHTNEVALGLKIWAPCLVMCHFLCGPEAPVVRSRRCLELGAGAGMMGVVLAGLGARATVSDIDEPCLRASKVNARLNGVSASCEALHLEYGTE
ncbi:unnamed protein product, partial [Polarella glacialis]